MTDPVSQLLQDLVSPLIGTGGNPQKYTAQGGIAAAYSNGEITYCSFGANSAEIDSSTVFGIGSVTKVLTTSILGQSPNLLNQAILPDLPPGFTLNELEAPVTYQMLATFTGGVPENTPSYPSNTTPAEQQIIFQKYIANVVPLYIKLPIIIPGVLPTPDVYSDCSIGLVGQTLMNSAGFADWGAADANNWYSANLLGDLSMSLTTATPVSPTQGWEWTEKGFQKIDYLPWVTWGTAGRMYSCASDMMNFLMANVGVNNVGGREVPAKIFSGMQVAQTGYVPNAPYCFPNEPWNTTSQGLAWIVWPAYDDCGPVCGKAGGLPCVSSYIALCPKEECGVIILLNTESVNVQPVARKIAKALQQMASPCPQKS